MTDLLNWLKPWLAWIHAHPQWVGVAAFMLAFVECLAVVGLLVPGTAIMTAIGALIGADIIAAPDAIFPAMLGAICGDAVSFVIGYRNHEHLRDLWPFKFYPRLLQKGEVFFYQHGGKGIFVGRFLGPIRPVLPIIAGMLNMPPWRFFLADIISAIFWAPLYMLPGILLGAASVELAPGMAMHLMLYVILALLVLWCISWLIKRFIVWLFNTIHRALDQVWAAIKHKPLLRPLSIALQDPLHPDSHAQLTLGLYVVLTGALFLWVALGVYHHNALTGWNSPLLYLLRSIRSTALDRIMLAFTLLGEPKVMLGVFTCVLVWLLSQRAWRTATHWVLLGILGFGGVEIIKHLVHSPRPAGLLAGPDGFSFPSGHTTLTAAIGGFFAVLVARELHKKQRWVPYTVIALIVFFVMLSRLYLGAHWLTDVLGGLLYAILIVMITTLSYHRQYTPKLSASRLSVVFALGWIFIGGIYTAVHYEKGLQDYALYIPGKTLNMAQWWARSGAGEPIYRLDRTGKPADVLNVQWAGDLATIEATLVARGWSVSPTTTLSLVMGRIATQTDTLQLPLLPQLYLDQRPVLVMTKPTHSRHTIVVLNLWDGRTIFRDSNLPLWLGSVTYYHVWQTGLFHLHPQHITEPAQSALMVLAQDIAANYAWQEVSDIAALGARSPLWWDGQLLLIKPKNLSKISPG